MIDGRAREEIRDTIEEVRFAFHNGRSDLMPVVVEMQSLSDRLDSLEREMKRALEFLVLDAQRALETMDAREFEPSFPDTKRLDQMRDDRENVASTLNTLCRTVRFMLDRQEG